MTTTQDLLDFDQTINPGNVKGAMRNASATSRDLWFVRPDELQVMPNFNVRIRTPEFEAGIRDLADSIKTNGFYPYRPLAGIVVRSGATETIYITDGHRRLEAAKLALSEGAPIEDLPVVISPKGTSMEDLTVALAQTNAGVPLTTYELALVCTRLSKFGMDSRQIGSRLSKSAQYVDKLLSLMAAPRPLRLLVEKGTVSATQAIEAIDRFGDKALANLEAAAATAAAAGKTRITGKHTAPSFNREVRKAGPKLFFAVRDLKTDPAYPSLSPQLREKLEELLCGLDQLEAADHSSDASTAKTSNDESQDHE